MFTLYYALAKLPPSLSQIFLASFQQRHTSLHVSDNIQELSSQTFPYNPLYFFLTSCTFTVKRSSYSCHHQVGRPLDKIISSSSSWYFPSVLISCSTKTTSHHTYELIASRQCLFYSEEPLFRFFYFE